MITTISKQISDVTLLPEDKRPEALRELAQKNSPAVIMLCWALDKNVRFNLPEGDPPYKPTDQLDQEGSLTQQFRVVRRQFIDDKEPPRTPKIKAAKEMAFIGILESVHPDDAKFLIAIKNKKVPKGITVKVMNEAFPGLLPE